MFVNVYHTTYCLNVSMKNNVSLIGLSWCFTFVMLDAIQAVYFGRTLQKLDSFLVGVFVFGLSGVFCLIWVSITDRKQWTIAADNKYSLLGLNLTAAGAWVSYLYAVQLIEPAIAFTIFSGLVPTVTIAAYYIGVPVGQKARNSWEAIGNILIIFGMIILICITIFGYSGFVRGNIDIAIIGLIFSVLAGVLISAMLLFCQHLDNKGMIPMMQFGLRFPLYILLALGGYIWELDYKGEIDIHLLLIAVGVGMFLLAFPIYAVQKAISLTSALTVGAIAASAPLIVFILQKIEGRVDFSTETLSGLSLYFVGAVIATIGALKC